MPVVLVHGNPETSDVWDPLVERLLALGADDPVRLSPPGFGAPVPAGWGATVEDYRSWLVRELEAIGTPVDLVGHDWGGGHVLNVAMTRPDLLRSWASDVVGIFDADYQWHDMAQVWQQPSAGEEAMAAWLQAPADLRAALLVERGMHPAVADRVGPALDAAMADCVLKLYRSAAQPALAQLGQRLEQAAARPGLALVASQDDMVGTEAQHRRAAARAGASVEVLDGVGHWWMTQDPQRGAEALCDFWTAH